MIHENLEHLLSMPDALTEADMASLDQFREEMESDFLEAEFLEIEMCEREVGILENQLARAEACLATEESSMPSECIAMAKESLMGCIDEDVYMAAGSTRGFISRTRSTIADFVRRIIAALRKIAKAFTARGNKVTATMKKLIDGLDSGQLITVAPQTNSNFSLLMHGEISAKQMEHASDIYCSAERPMSPGTIMECLEAIMKSTNSLGRAKKSAIDAASEDTDKNARIEWSDLIDLFFPMSMATIIKGTAVTYGAYAKDSGGIYITEEGVPTTVVPITGPTHDVFPYEDRNEEIKEVCFMLGETWRAQDKLDGDFDQWANSLLREDEGLNSKWVKASIDGASKALQLNFRFLTATARLMSNTVVSNKLKV